MIDFRSIKRVFRPINLLLVGIAQLLLFTHLVYPVLHNAGITPDIGHIFIYLLAIVTVLITWSGYLINDIYDYDIDISNHKPHPWTKHTCQKFYYATIIVGFVLATIIAYQVAKLQLLWIYPLAVILLYSYARWWKLKGNIGNIIVSIMCGGVLAVILVAEPQLLNSTNPSILLAGSTVAMFSIFAILANYIREIIKDLEDIQGDKTALSQSLPITIGEAKTKQYLHGLCILLIILICGWSYYLWDSTREIRLPLFNAIFIIASTARLMLGISQANHTQSYHRMASWMKMIIIAGIISMILTFDICAG